MYFKRLLSIVLSVVFICAGIPGAAAESTGAFYAENDILMYVGKPDAFYKRDKVPVDILNGNVSPYKKSGTIYVPLEFVTRCANVRLIKDLENIGAYTVNGNAVSAVMKNGTPYITAKKAAEITGRNTLIDGDCVVLTYNSSNTGYDSIFKKARNDFDNTYHVVPDEGKGTVFAKSAALYGTDCEYREFTADICGTRTTGARLIVNEKPQYSYSTKFEFTCETGIKKSDVGLVSFYARSGTAGAAAKMSVTMERRSDYQKILAQEIELGNEWKKYDLPFTAEMDMEKNNSRLYFGLGYAKQVIEIADAKTVLYSGIYREQDLPSTALTYKNQSDREWYNAALSDISENRVKDVTVKLLDEKANPIKDAEVEITMEDHLFNYGTSVNQFYVTETTKEDVGNGYTVSENISRFKSTLKEYFNTAVPENAYKWALWAGRKQNSDMCATVLKEMGLRMRGHVLWWDAIDFAPKGSDGKPAEVTDEDVKNHISELAEAYKGRTAEWDVLNEPVKSRGIFLKDTEYGSEAIIKDWFDTARRADPNAILYVNETNITGEDGDNFESFKKIVDGMIANSVDFDAVGIQAHMSSYPQSPKKMSEIIKSFTDLGKKVSITEYDMFSRNEQLQADYLKDLFIASYANPNVIGFNMWGHWDNDHWRRLSPMFRSDWTPKPGALIWQGLTKHVFASNVKGRSAADGTVKAELYEGTYNVRVTRNGVLHEYKLTVSDSGAHTIRFENSLYDLPYLYDFEGRSTGEYLSAAQTDNSGQQVGQWSGYVSGVVNIGEAEDMGHVIKCTSTSDINIQHNMAYNTNTVNLKLSMNISERNRTRTINAIDNSGKETAMMKISAINGGKNEVYYYGAGGYVKLAEISADKWFDFNFEINPVMKTFKAAITDKSGNIAAYTEKGVLNAASGGNLRKWSVCSKGTAAEMMYIDNVSMSRSGGLYRKIVQAQDNGSIPQGTRELTIYTGESIKAGAKAEVYREHDGVSEKAENACVNFTSDKITADLNESAKKGYKYTIHFTDSESVFGHKAEDISVTADASVNPVKEVKLMSGANTITKISQWDKKSELKLKVAADTDYFEKETDTVMLAKYNADGMLTGVQLEKLDVGTEKAETEYAVRITAADIPDKLKIFIWNIGMRPLHEEFVY